MEMDDDDYIGEEDGVGIVTPFINDEIPPVKVSEVGNSSWLKTMHKFFLEQLSTLSLSYIWSWITIVLVISPIILCAIKLFIDKLFYLKSRARQTTLTYTWTNTVHQAGEILTAEISTVSSADLTEREKQKLYSYLNIYVKYNGQTIMVFRSLSANNAVIAMTLKQAGEYSFHSSYVLFRFFKFEINGSPHQKRIGPGMIIASKTEFNGQSGTNGDTVTVASGLRYYFKIQPKDRYGNLCPKESVNLRLFKFEHRQLDAAVGDPDHSRNPFSTRLINHSFDVNSFGELCLIMSIPVGSWWEGKLAYNNQPISGGEFDMISLTKDEEDTLSRIVIENITTKEQQFEGFAEMIGSHFQCRYMHIFVGLSPTKLQLYNIDATGNKNKFMTYNISARAKILFHHMKEMNGQRLYCLAIDDDVNDRFVFYMNHSKGRCFLALYFHYKAINDNIKIQFPFETKRNIFFQELGLRLSEAEITLQKHHIRISSNPDTILQCTYDQISRLSIRDWREEFVITFEGQAVNGEGNLATWFSLLMDSMFTNNLKAPGMFSKHGKSRYVHPNPVHHRNNYKWRPQLYHLAGRILGKYLVEMALDRLRNPVFRASLSRSLFSILIGFTPSYEEVFVDHPEIYEQRFLSVLKAADVSKLNRNFAEEYDCCGKYISRPIDLIPSGSSIKVTNENRERYLHCLAKYYMFTLTYDEIHNFRTGFYTLVPEEMLTILDATDLEKILIYGKTSPTKVRRSFCSWFFGSCNTQEPNGNINAPRAPWESCREHTTFHSPESSSQNSNNNTWSFGHRPNVSDHRSNLPRNNDNFQSPFDERTRSDFSDSFRNLNPENDSDQQQRNSNGDPRHNNFGFPSSANRRGRDAHFGYNGNT